MAAVIAVAIATVRSHQNNNSPLSSMSIPYKELAPLLAEPWMLWLDGAHSPFFNMAADQVLLDHIAGLGKPLLRIYQWDCPSVSFGRSQHYPVNIPEEYAVVRRPTGGGVVWHDGDLTYTIVLPVDHPLATLSMKESYQFIHEAILAKLESGTFLKDSKDAGADPRTMQCFRSPSPFDIMGPTGVKYAGAAQFRSNKGLLNQGSVKLEATAGDWGRMKTTILRAFECVAKAEYVLWTPDATLLAEIELKSEEQYKNYDWNHDGTLPKTTKICGEKK